MGIDDCWKREDLFTVPQEEATPRYLDNFLPQFFCPKTHFLRGDRIFVDSSLTRETESDRGQTEEMSSDLTLTHSLPSGRFSSSKNEWGLTEMNFFASGRCGEYFFLHMSVSGGFFVWKSLLGLDLPKKRIIFWAPSFPTVQPVL